MPYAGVGCLTNSPNYLFYVSVPALLIVTMSAPAAPVFLAGTEMGLEFNGAFDGHSMDRCHVGEQASCACHVTIHTKAHLDLLQLALLTSVSEKHA